MSQTAPAARVRTVFPGFDGLRAIAALAVFLTHATFVAGANPNNAFGVFFARMNAGVAVFFLISGFLLYRPFVAARFDTRPAPAARPYFWRRLLRIYPAYWIALTIIVVVLRASPYDGQYSPPPGDWFSDPWSVFLYYSLLNIYSLGHVFGPLTQAWTLSTELTFYAFVPLFAFALRQVGRAGTAMRMLRVEMVGLATLVVTSAIWKAWVLNSTYSLARRGQLKTWLPWWLDLFALGMLLAVVSVWITATDRPAPFGLGARRAPAFCWLLALASFWVVSTRLDLPTMTIEYPSAWSEALEHYLYGATALFLLLPAVFGNPEEGRVRGFLTSRVMVFLGTISYGIYLWHEAWLDRYLEWADIPVFTVYTGDRPFAFWTSNLFSAPFVVMLAVTLGLTVASASLSWYLAERPILRLKDLPRRAAS